MLSRARCKPKQKYKPLRGFPWITPVVHFVMNLPDESMRIVGDSGSSCQRKNFSREGQNSLIPDRIAVLLIELKAFLMSIER